MQGIFNKLASYAALADVIGAIGGGFMAWGEFNNRIAQLEDKEFSQRDCRLIRHYKRTRRFKG